MLLNLKFLTRWVIDSMNEIDDLIKAIESYDEKAAINAADRYVTTKADPINAIHAATAVIRNMGEKFSKMKICLPELIIASNATDSAMKVLESALPKGTEKEEKKKIVIGTVKGDIHDIGKNIVSALCKAEGFEIYDLGKDVSVEDFIEKAEEVGTDIIGVSALMTTTTPVQKDLIEELSRLGVRKKYRVIIGGGSISEEWSREIGADDWADNATDAVAKVTKIV